MSQEEAKTLFLQSVNDCARKTGVSNSFFKSFDKEMKDLQKIVTVIPEYTEIVQSVPKSKTYNQIGSAINRIFCMYENQVLQECISELNEKGIELAVLMFDGLMVYGDHYSNTEFLTESYICSES